MFDISWFIWLFNIAVLIVIVGFAIWVFIDSLKRNQKFLPSLGWALLALLFFPPIGFIIYLVKRNTHKQ